MTTARDAQAQKRKTTDWQAVERDYRATNLSLRELGLKHNCKAPAIANRAKRYGWERDLTEAVKQATNARLIANAAVEKAVAHTANGEADATTNAVLAAAEVNVRIVTGHRKRLADLYILVEGAQEKLERMGSTMESVRDAAVFVQAVAHLTNSTKTLIEAERKAFGLDEKQQDDVKPTAEDFIEAFRGQEG